MYRCTHIHKAQESMYVHILYVRTCIHKCAMYSRLESVHTYSMHTKHATKCMHTRVYICSMYTQMCMYICV